MKNRAVVSLLAAGVALLAGDLVVHFASPAQAQTGADRPVRTLVGITHTNYGPWLYRAWSDGAVEIRDVNAAAPPAWNGWRALP
jgi:ABC-type cobalt transport system substrate-binding protein